jgi:hypothetical protein
MAHMRIVLTVICLCLMFGTGVTLYAQPPRVSSEELQQRMQEHIDKVKITNPGEYQKMIERAGESITHCCSCHQETCEQSFQGQIPTAPK